MNNINETTYFNNNNDENNNATDRDNCMEICIDENRENNMYIESDPTSELPSHPKIIYGELQPLNKDGIKYVASMLPDAYNKIIRKYYK